MDEELAILELYRRTLERAMEKNEEDWRKWRPFVFHCQTCHVIVQPKVHMTSSTTGRGSAAIIGITYVILNH